MTFEHHSPLRPGRVYHRKFDHDEARALLAAGWTQKAVADRLGVDPSSIQKISSPEQIAKARERTRKFTAAVCEDCGEPCTHNRYSERGRHDRVVCRVCSGRRHRKDHLLERMNDAGDILCRGCGRHRPPTEFWLSMTGMPRPRCKECDQRRRCEYRAANLEADRAYQREYRQRHQG